MSGQLEHTAFRVAPCQRHFFAPTPSPSHAPRTAPATLHRSCDAPLVP